MISSEPSPRAPSGDERGLALIAVLLALLFASLTAALMMSFDADRWGSGLHLRGPQALQPAEAGIAEARTRIRAGDVPNEPNPRMVARIFSTAGSGVPRVGPDTLALPGTLPRLAWVDGVASPDGHLLTIEYKTTPDRTTIYRYDPTRNPAIQTDTGTPIYVIRSTGRRAGNRIEIVTEVAPRPIRAKLAAALTAGKRIRFIGTSDVCGWNHDAETPAGTRGRGACLGWELDTGERAGAWSTGRIANGRSSAQNGVPARAAERAAFPAGPWEPLGMNQADFFDWVGPPLAATSSLPRGIVHLDDNATAQDASGSFGYTGGGGEGLLYVDGDLHLDGLFTFRGLMYVEGDLVINGACWVLGAVVVRGRTKVELANGRATILYSEEAIRRSISKYGAQLLTFSWRDQRHP